MKTITLQNGQPADGIDVVKHLISGGELAVVFVGSPVNSGARNYCITVLDKALMGELEANEVVRITSAEWHGSRHRPHVGRLFAWADRYSDNEAVVAVRSDPTHQVVVQCTSAQQKQGSYIPLRSEQCLARGSVVVVTMVMREPVHASYDELIVSMRYNEVIRVCWLNTHDGARTECFYRYDGITLISGETPAVATDTLTGW